MTDSERSIRRFSDGGIVPPADDVYYANKMVAIDKILASEARDTVDATTTGLIQEGRHDRDWAHVEACETALDVLFSQGPTGEKGAFYTQERHTYQSSTEPVGGNRYYLTGDITTFKQSSVITNALIGIRHQVGEAPSENDPVAYQLVFKDGVAERPGTV